MKLSREMQKLIDQMALGVSYSPTSTGFSIGTFEALERRGLVNRIGWRIFTINTAGTVYQSQK